MSCVTPCIFDAAYQGHFEDYEPIFFTGTKYGNNRNNSNVWIMIDSFGEKHECVLVCDNHQYIAINSCYTLNVCWKPDPV